MIGYIHTAIHVPQVSCPSQGGPLTTVCPLSNYQRAVGQDLPVGRSQAGAVLVSHPRKSCRWVMLVHCLLTNVATIWWNVMLVVQAVASCW